jgi:hydroxymethylglutaryl-CoA lyase
LDENLFKKTEAAFDFKFGMIKIIETPRDAMQGIKEFIPTSKKIDYLNALLEIGFDTLDFGSFVSAKAIPQLRDTESIIEKLIPSNTKLLAIVANLRGAQNASRYEQINYLGYPFSISNTFLQLNINSNLEKAFQDTEQIQSLCRKTGKQLVVYISMAFGNPYGDFWHADLVYKWTKKLQEIGIEIIALSDTIGIGNPNTISQAFRTVVNEFPHIEFGAHLHTTRHNCFPNIQAAFDNGCRRFDTVMNGLGGCPMSKQEMIGNLKTGNLLAFIDSKGIETSINMAAYQRAIELETITFPAV